MLSKPKLKFANFSQQLFTGVFVTAITAAAGVMLFVSPPAKPYVQDTFRQLSPRQQELIAHAGGAVHGKIYTNSLQALDQSYALGYRLIELDFHWTSDQQLALIHDWERAPGILFENMQGRATYDQFMQAKMVLELTQMNLERLDAWVQAHPGVIIVTDFKEKNVEGLNYIKTHHKALAAVLLPQIVSYTEYEAVRSLGFKDIILTMYRMETVVYAELQDFIHENQIFALVFPVDRSEHQEFMRVVDSLDIRTYVHTVNNELERQNLIKKGIEGIFTDVISPSQFAKAARGADATY